MNVINLADLLLSPEEKNELQSSVQMLQDKNFSAFYDQNQDVIRGILFLESAEEFLDFSEENSLDLECFCAAFLCAKGYGLQAGGYEDDLTHPLTEFFQSREIDCPEVFEIIQKEKIYTDCGDDNFKEVLTAVNEALAPHGKRAVVLEDFVYCDCEYTVFLLDQALAGEVASSWQSGSFELCL